MKKMQVWDGVWTIFTWWIWGTIKILVKSIQHGTGKSLRLQKCPYRVNLSGASNLSSFNMTQCSRTISSTVFGLISLLSWLVLDYHFLMEKLEGKMGTYSETM